MNAAHSLLIRKDLGDWNAQWTPLDPLGESEVGHRPEYDGDTQVELDRGLGFDADLWLKPTT